MTAQPEICATCTYSSRVSAAWIHCNKHHGRVRFRSHCPNWKPTKQPTLKTVYPGGQPP